MESQVRIETAGDVIEVHASGVLTRETYEAFVPVFEAGLREHGKLRVLFVMRDFHGWTAGALWDDLKFDLKHFAGVRRLALVGETKWQQGMSIFCKPFTTAKVRYFPTEELEAARAWLRESSAETAAKPS